MKKYAFFILWLFLFSMACTSKAPSHETTKELALRQRVAGSVSSVGEVNWYHYRAVEANNVMQVTCSNNTYRSDVELLVSVYQADQTGHLQRLYADHTPNGSLRPAEIKINIYIDAPKDIYISVRDLMDDESSTNPYYLFVDFASSSGGNENFASADPLIVDGATSTDCIGYIGDVDCYKFEAPADGVYDISVDFNPFSGGTSVELSLDLYDHNGTLLESVSNVGHQDNLYLMAGEYYILIDDYGRNDFDSASTYEIGVKSVLADEKYKNDTREKASAMEYDQDNRLYSVSASLEYRSDKDWYRFSLPEADPDGFPVLLISFDNGSEDNAGANVTYQINIEDSEKNVLLSHCYQGGSSRYETQIKAGLGDHYLLVQAADGQVAPYRVSIQVLDVIDEAEETALDPETGETRVGNNTIDTADVLLPGVVTTAKISYRGDEDWYRLDVDDSSKSKVLEVFLDTNSIPSPVDYSLSLMRDSIIKKDFQCHEKSAPAKLKMSILVPASDSPFSYFFKVGDYQGDDGDGLTNYRIRANLVDIPESLPVDPNDSIIDPNRVVYYSETAEMADDTATTIELEHNSLLRKKYTVNTSLLDFHDPNQVGDPNRLADLGIIIEKSDDLTTISFPWIGGYLDYQGDQDWFQIDLEPLASLGEDQQCYYDIKIDLHVAAPGSPVEYVWKFYRDRNQNQIMVDRPRDSNGFMASAGDRDTDIKPLDISIPGPGQQFWVGDAWQGKFYLSLSDFNYVNSPYPDDDWGYSGAPYYFKVTLVYHSGQSYP